MCNRFQDGAVFKRKGKGSGEQHEAERLSLPATLLRKEEERLDERTLGECRDVRGALCTGVMPTCMLSKWSGGLSVQQRSANLPYACWSQRCQPFVC